MAFPSRPFLLRFWEKIERRGELECWPWLGSKVLGYGHIRVGRRSRRKVYAHRVVYKLLRGPIGAGLEPDHLCRNPGCQNPWHMELVTRQENVRRERRAVEQHRRSVVELPSERGWGSSR